MYARLPDKNESANYYKSAGQDTEAFNCLGLLYEEGIGIDAAYNIKRSLSGSSSLSLAQKTLNKRRLSNSNDKEDKDFDDERYLNHPNRGIFMA